jgi:hypothetical protein
VAAIERINFEIKESNNDEEQMVDHWCWHRGSAVRRLVHIWARLMAVDFGDARVGQLLIMNCEWSIINI